MIYNNMSLQNGEALRLQGCYDNGTALDFSVLSRLTGTDLLFDVPHKDMHVVLEPAGSVIPENGILAFGSRSLQTVYHAEKRQFSLYLKDCFPYQKTLYGIYVWQVATVCACTAALLRGEPLVMMHCAMLERNGEALLLCGESGIGKSTSSRRWLEDGGTAVADDMVLLEFTKDDEILVHRLPTWSACRERLEGREYLFNPPLKLKSVLALTRSEDGNEQVQDVKMSDFYAQIYHCIFFHYQEMFRPMTAEYSRFGAMRLREFTDKLTACFPAKALFASLTGNIRSTLKDYL